MKQKKHSFLKTASMDKTVLKERISNELDIPLSSMSGISNIELVGNREAIVEGCKGVLEYNDTSIKLNLGKSIVRFSGSELSIKSLQYEQAIISGTILTVEFL